MLVADKWGRRPAIIVPCIIAVFLTPLYLWTTDPLWIVFGFILQGVFGGSIYGQNPSYLGERFPTEVRSHGAGLRLSPGRDLGRPGGAGHQLLRGQEEDGLRHTGLATNFLHESQGGVAPIARLDADEALQMIERIVAAHPQVRTIIFQDDIFVFTKDRRVLPLCEAIVAAKASGRIPASLQFISTNRIDAMSEERLQAMRRAGFRVLGFGIENFSPRVLAEFNKAQIYRHIEPMLEAAVGAGITPFLDLILSSPGASMEDVAITLREAHRWLHARL